ncbi:MAG: hypothetical protein AAGJ84_07345 [Pseudomonadota bacterium]
MKIAYLSSIVTLPGSPQRRDDAFEHDRMMDALRGPFGKLGYDIEDVDWAVPDQDWSQYAAALIGTTWDYWDRPTAFLKRLEEIEAVTALFNSSALVRWNSHKGYLRELETRGALTIPTLWIDQVDAVEAAAAFDTLGPDLVFKRQIGAGADGQFRLSPTDPLPKMPHPMMVQPFLSQIQAEGELSFIFIDGGFCHALQKQAASGDYRIQSTYGGVETPISPSATDMASAQAVLELLDSVPLYARVDMLRGEDGALRLMELELIEPYLYPVEGPQLGGLMAAAVHRRLCG